MSEEKRDFEKDYRELVNAVCSVAWVGRDRHKSVVDLAERLRDNQTILGQRDLERIALYVGLRSRTDTA